MIGTYIKGSKVINEQMSCSYINLSTSDSLGSIGTYNIRKPLVLLKILLKLFKALLTAKFDVCYMTLTSNGSGFYKDMLIVFILKLFNNNIIYHFHNKGVAAFSKNPLNNFLYKVCFKNTCSLLISEKLYTDIAKYVDAINVFYCPNGIPENKNSLFNMERIKPQKPCNLLFMSNMMAEKGVYVLLEACKLLRGNGLDFKCHFVGAWSDVTEKDFNHAASKMGVTDRVFAHGSRYNEEKSRFFIDADIFVFPTYYHNECFPLVLLEALSYGLPIVTTPEGGISDIVIEQQNGFLVQQRDVAQLAGQLELLINQLDLRLQMGKAGYLHFKNHFTSNKFENKLLDILTAMSDKQRNQHAG